MKRNPVNSSNLVSLGYENGILEVEFHGGSICQYYDVPEEIYVELMNAESKGEYLHRHIKTQGYRYKKIEEGISESPLDAANTEEQKLAPCEMLEPIWEAAEGGNWDTVKLWLKHDPSLIGAVMHNDWTLLHLAVFSPSIETLEFLVGQGADVNVKDKFDKTPFRLAIESNFNTEIVKSLFSRGTKHDNVEIVETQHECGVDDNDNQKEYFLWLDKYLSDTVTELKELEKKYGVLNRCQLEIELDELKKELEDLEYQINNEWDCKRGYLEEWEDELEEVSKKLEERENVVAWWETVYDKFDELNKWYITPIQKYATTILQCATANSANVKVLKYLVSQGGDANVKDEYGETLLHLAAATNTNVDVLEYLIQQGINTVNVKNKWEMTPLHFSAEQNSNVEVLKYLVSQGADTNARDKNGRTPLHYYAHLNQNVTILEYLVTLGIDLNTKDKEGDTPLHVAARYNLNVDVEKYLVSQGADVNAKNNEDFTPFNVNVSETKREYLFTQKKRNEELMREAVTNEQWDIVKQWIERDESIFPCHRHYDYWYCNRELIWKIAVKEKWDIVKRWLECDPSLITTTGTAYIGYYQCEQLTLLHLAATKKSCVEFLEFLVLQGANIKAKDNWGKMPLDYADSEEKKRILREAMSRQNN